MAARRLRRIALDSTPQARTRRLAVAALLAALCLGAAVPAAAQQVRMLVQSSPLAGFSHHEGRALWTGLSRGDTLALVREADNPHDTNAVAVLRSAYKPTAPTGRPPPQPKSCLTGSTAKPAPAGS